MLLKVSFPKLKFDELGKQLVIFIDLLVILKIHHFHIEHNAPCLPPKILYNHCFQFLPGITVVTTEFEDNVYANVLAVKQGALWSM